VLFTVTTSTLVLNSHCLQDIYDSRRAALEAAHEKVKKDLQDEKEARWVWTRQQSVDSYQSS
jgi:hypothetical protein